MPRIYKPDPRGKRYFSPYEENLKKALADKEANSNLSIRNAAKKLLRHKSKRRRY